MIQSIEMQGYWYKYPHPAVTADSVVFGYDGRDLYLLLIERGIEPYKGCWALPGGFMRMDETVMQCALRELKEETGVNIDYIREFATFSMVNRDPRERVITVAHIALVRKSDYELIAGDDAVSAHWWNLNEELPELAFDHLDIVQKARQTLKERAYFEPIAFHMLNDKFSMTELQTLYELILERRFDRRNFRKKMLNANIIEPTFDKCPTGGRMSNLFSFSEKKYNYFKSDSDKDNFEF